MENIFEELKKRLEERANSPEFKEETKKLKEEYEQRERERNERTKQEFAKQYFSDARKVIGEIHERKIEDLKQSNPEVYKFLNKWEISEHFGFCFTGPVGSGKTYAMTCIMNKIANALIENSQSPRENIYWNTASNLIEEIKSCINEEENVVDFMAKIQRKHFMFIDDFGAQKNTDYGAEKLTSILDFRVNHKLPTFFTTNCNIKDMKEFFGERIISRISELSVIVEIKGKDRRTTIHNQRLTKLKE